MGLHWRQRSVIVGISRQGRRITQNLRRATFHPPLYLQALTLLHRLLVAQHRAVAVTAQAAYHACYGERASVSSAPPTSSAPPASPGGPLLSSNLNCFFS